MAVRSLSQSSRGPERAGRPRLCAGAAVLAAGLMLLPACHSCNDASGYAPSRSDHRQPQVVRVKESPECESGTITGKSGSSVHYRKGRCVVREGDSLLKMGIAQAEGATFDIRVSKVDGSGVELTMHTDYPDSEHASNARSPLRLEYGQEARTDIIGGTLISAESGTEEGTAIVVMRDD